ncbi:MAG: DUF1749 domain-containing protein [Nostocaceae cyanobacterium]|nr:DUF1749 domain-containing protein [Nostocaceae cyanobacterium]
MFATYLLLLSKNELSKPYTQRLPCSILFQPVSPPQQRQGIGVLYLHGWNGYPYSPVACSLGSALATQGFVFISLGMGRRGVEGQMKALPDDDIADISRGVEYFHSCGVRDIILVGEEIGALSAVRYQCQTQDSRVKGIVLIHPFPDLAPWLQNAIGKERYFAVVDKSETEVILTPEGKYWVDLTIKTPDGGNLLIYQSFEAWLAWWGENADTRISVSLEALSTPLLVVDSKQEETVSKNAVHVDDEANLLAIFPDWVSKLESSVTGEFQLVQSDVTQPLEIVTVQTSDGSNLVGLLWETSNSRVNKTAVLHVRGKTGTPITEPLFAKLAEVYNQQGIAAMVIELRRSGYGGSLGATADMDIDDIAAFVEFLVNRGYTRIVLSGQSLGSNSIMRYQSFSRHPNVIALVHMAPTRDCADWLEKHIGSDVYNSLVAEAKQAVQAGCGEQGLIGKPPYQWMLSPHRPQSWLSWSGPEADTVNLKTIADIEIPILMLCGSKDFFNDRERLNQLQAAATRSQVTNIIWYEGCGHDFAGFEQEAAGDVIEWLKGIEQI